MKGLVKRLPVVGPCAVFLHRQYRRWSERVSFTGSANYWEGRYAAGGNSGQGSFGELAHFKARVLNDFVERHGVRTVIEFGCGDGNQLRLARYPSYAGYDVSHTAIQACRTTFADDASKSFHLVSDHRRECAELALSIDVVYHLVEDAVFDRYMGTLFDAATRFVIVYSSNFDRTLPGQSVHVRHREFTKWVSAHRPEWRMTTHIPNALPFAGDYSSGSFADFYAFSKA